MSDNGMQYSHANGQSSSLIVDGQDSDLDDELKKLLEQVREWRKFCKNTAQALQELNGFLRE